MVLPDKDYPSANTRCDSCQQDIGAVVDVVSQPQRSSYWLCLSCLRKAVAMLEQAQGDVKAGAK